MKQHTRVLGFDDAPFLFGDEKVLVVGVLMRLPSYLEAVLSTYVDVDGMDSTDSLLECLSSSRYSEQPSAIMVDGASLGGFNVIDMERLWKETGIPIITVTRDPPDMKSIRCALEKHFFDWETRLSTMDKNKLFKVDTGHNPIYASAWGIGEEDAKQLIRSSTILGALPECIRVAHLIAHGICKGESRGKY